MALPSESLFPEPGGSEEDRVRMLELLVACLGQDHTLYWVYRERIVGAGEDAHPRWYLHGLFG
jgi:hypothetical protein